MALEAGVVRLAIVPDTSRFRSQAETAVKKALAGVDGKVDIHADASGLGREIDRAIKLQTGHGVSVPVRAVADNKSVKAAINQVARGAKDVSVNVKANASGTQGAVASLAELEKMALKVEAAQLGVERAQKRVTDATGKGSLAQREAANAYKQSTMRLHELQDAQMKMRHRGGGGGDDGGGGRRVGFNTDGFDKKSLSQVTNAMDRFIIPAAFMSAIAALPQLLTIAGGAAVALGASLSNLTGIAGALPGLLLAGGAAAGTVALAFSGLKDAVKALGDVQSKSGTDAKAQATAQQAAGRQMESAQAALSTARQQAADLAQSAAARVSEAERGVAEAHRASKRDIESATRGVAEAVTSAADKMVDADARVATAHAGAVETRRRGNEQIAQAEDAAASAKDRLVEAEARSEEAHRSVAMAVADEVVRLEELRAESNRNGLSIERAEINVAKARENLAKSTGKSSLEQREANLAVREAVAHLDELKERQAAQQRDIAKGLKGSEAIRTARQKEAAAAKDVRDAQKDVGKTDAGVGKARQEAAADLKRSLADVTAAEADRVKTARQNERDIADAQKNVTEVRIQADNRIVTAERTLMEAEASRARQARDSARSIQDAQRQVAAAAVAMTAANEKASAGSETLQRAMDKLSPAGQRFARTLHELTNGPLKALRTTAQEHFLGPLDGQVRSLADHYFPLLNTVVGETADSLGRTFGGAVKAVTSGPFKDQFARVTHANIGLLDDLGQAGVNLLGPLLQIADAARPLVAWLGQLVLGWTQNIAKFIQAKYEGGQMAAFFERARATMVQVLEITGHLGSAIVGIFTSSGAQKAGGDFLGTIDRTVKRFDDWVHSDAGQQKLRDFFSWIQLKVGQIALDFQKLGAWFSAHPELLKVLDHPVLLGTTVAAVAKPNAAINIAGGIGNFIQVALLQAGIKSTVGKAVAKAAAAGAPAAASAPQISIPLVLTLAGLVIAAGALAAAYAKIKPFKALVDGVWDGIIHFDAQKIINTLTTQIPLLVTWFQLNVWPKVKELGEGLWKRVTDIDWSKVAEKLGIFLGQLLGWWNFTVLPKLYNTIGQLGPKIGEWLGEKDNAAKLFGFLAGFQTKLLLFFGKMAVSLAKGLVSGLVDQFVRSELGSSIINHFVDVFNGVVDLLNGFLKKVTEAINIVKPGTNLNWSVGKLGKVPTPAERTKNTETAKEGGGAGRNHARGGHIRGPGTSTSDSIPAMLSDGEYVVNAKATQQYLPHLQWLNAQGLADGGMVGRVQSWIKSTDAMPYVFGATGPRSFDCSGLVGTVANMLTGSPPYQRRFTTKAFAGGRGAGGFAPGKGAFTIGVRPTGNPGHMVGNLAGLGFEARSTKTGIFVGSAAKSVDAFPYQFHLPEVAGKFVPDGGGGDSGGGAAAAIAKKALDAAGGALKSGIGRAVGNGAAGALAGGAADALIKAASERLTTDSAQAAPTGDPAVTTGNLGGGLSGEQRAVLNTAVNTAKSMGASKKVLVALIEAGLVESNLRSLAYGDRDSQGFLQQRPSQGWGSVAEVRDVAHATRSFVRRAMAIEGKYSSSGRLAQGVQRSAFPDRYDAREAQAKGLLGFAKGGLVQGLAKGGQVDPVKAARTALLVLQQRALKSSKLGLASHDPTISKAWRAQANQLASEIPTARENLTVALRPSMLQGLRKQYVTTPTGATQQRTIAALSKQYNRAVAMSHKKGPNQGVLTAYAKRLRDQHTTEVAKFFAGAETARNLGIDKTRISKYGQFVDSTFEAKYSDGVPSGTPKYAAGIDFVPNDQLAYLHKGEAVLNKGDAQSRRDGTHYHLTVNNNGQPVTLEFLQRSMRRLEHQQLAGAGV